MTVYRMAIAAGTNKYRNLRWAMVTINILFGILMIGIIFNFQVLDNIILFILSPIYLLILIIGTQRYFRKYEETWTTIEIEVGEDYIESSQKHKQSIRIHRDEISHLSSKKGITVHTTNVFKSIHIPEKLGRFEEVKDAIGDWAPYMSQSNEQAKKLAYPLLIMVAGIIISVIIAVITRSPWAVAFVILTLAFQTAYLIWATFHRMDIAARSKSLRILYYGLFFLGLIYFFVILIINILSMN
ncbi:MAG: hypothetical protein OEV06_05845 [Anaerolineae bacterium]|nr:hypothetical protein [Anaerolineae bacterium]